MKKILLGIAFALIAVSSQASYLYWQLDNTVAMQNTGTSYTLGQTTGDTLWYSAKVWAVNGSSQTAMELGTVDTAGQYQSLGVDEIGTAGRYLVNLGDMTGDGYSYYVEYLGYNYNTGETGQIGTGTSSTYEQLASSIVDYNSSGLIPVETASVWHGGTANAPEPTSAMLMLLGVAGLALRRKQRKIA